MLTSGWYGGADVLRDPLPLGELVDTSVTATVYLVVDGVLLVVRMVCRDAQRRATRRGQLLVRSWRTPVEARRVQ